MGKIEVEYRPDAIFDRALELVDAHDEWPDVTPKEMLALMATPPDLEYEENHTALKVFFEFISLIGGWPSLPPCEFVARMRQSRMQQHPERSPTCLPN